MVWALFWLDRRRCRLASSTSWLLTATKFRNVWKLARCYYIRVRSTPCHLEMDKDVGKAVNVDLPSCSGWCTVSTTLRKGCRRKSSRRAIAGAELECEGTSKTLLDWRTYTTYSPIHSRSVRTKCSRLPGQFSSKTLKHTHTPNKLAELLGYSKQGAEFIFLETEWWMVGWWDLIAISARWSVCLTESLIWYGSRIRTSTTCRPGFLRII